MSGDTLNARLALFASNASLRVLAASASSPEQLSALVKEAQVRGLPILEAVRKRGAPLAAFNRDDTARSLYLGAHERVEELDRCPKGSVEVERGALEPELDSNDPKRNETMWVRVDDLIDAE